MNKFNTMKRTFVNIFLFGGILIAFLDEACAVQCYKCLVTPSYRIDLNTSTQLCSKFDGSNKFVVDCPYSTMCVKRVLKLELQHDQTVETITRDCASQKYTDQVFKQGSWKQEHKVEEPYDEGCKDLEENNLSASTTTYCHCRGNLCNSASKDSNGYHADAMAVIFVFNVMKYAINIRNGAAQY